MSRIVKLSVKQLRFTVSFKFQISRVEDMVLCAVFRTFKLEYCVYEIRNFIICVDRCIGFILYLKKHRIPSIYYFLRLSLIFELNYLNNLKIYEFFVYFYNKKLGLQL